MLLLILLLLLSFVVVQIKATCYALPCNNFIEIMVSNWPCVIVNVVATKGVVLCTEGG